MPGCGSTYREAHQWVHQGGYTMLAGAGVAAVGGAIMLTAASSDAPGPAIGGAFLLGAGVIFVVPLGAIMAIGGAVGESRHPRGSDPPEPPSSIANGQPAGPSPEFVQCRAHRSEALRSAQAIGDPAQRARALAAAPSCPEPIVTPAAQPR